MSIKLKGSTDGSVTLQAPADTSPTGTDKTLTLPTGVGSANQVLKNGSTAGTLEYGTAGFKSMQVFTSVGSSTYTKPSGITRIKVYVTGGGGGGGGANGDDTAGAGGAGGTAIKVIDVTSITSVTVTVGGGGAGAAVNVNSSSPGGTSSFGTHCSATGGDRYGGNWAIAGGGGTATGGDINISGSDGIGGLIDSTGQHTPGGTGGASFWGQGGKGASRATSAQTNGTAFGSGGGGAGDSDTSANGAPGIVVVEEYA
jgi:hypothetical protein|tara:strand:+ start:85 stop:852 length:768 start_codon:yes stop_codon:yes gene_type:complete